MSNNNEDLEKAEQYYRAGREPALRATKKFVKDSGLIVHGGRAINAHLPEWLERETRDWDVFTGKNAEGYAKELEQKLDKRYGGDYFTVETGVHPGTYRVRNKITGEVIADITLKKKTIEFKNIDGINYATLEYHENRIEEILADPDAKFRHRRDAEVLQRIRIHKKRKKKKVRRSIDTTTVTGIQQ